MISSKPTNIDEYIREFPKEIQKNLNLIRATIAKAAPGAEEKISYGMPAFSFKSRPMVYFAAYTNHIGLYPAPRGHQAFKELDDYKGGKGTVQFALNEVPPLGLVSKIVKFRVKDILETAALREQTKKKKPAKK